MVLGGNLASAFKMNNISWRAAPLGLAVTAFVVAVAIAALIREPKKGRFIVQVCETSLRPPLACIWAWLWQARRQVINPLLTTEPKTVRASQTCMPGA